MSDVTRLVVVSDEGRLLDLDIKTLILDYQDGGKTLKVFVRVDPK